MIHVQIARVMRQHKIRHDLPSHGLDRLHDIQGIQPIEAVVGEVQLVQIGAEDFSGALGLTRNVCHLLIGSIVVLVAGSNSLSKDENVHFASVVDEPRHRCPRTQDLVVGMGSYA